MNCNNFTFQEKKTFFIQFTFMELNSVRKYNKNCSLCLIKKQEFKQVKTYKHKSSIRPEVIQERNIMLMKCPMIILMMCPVGKLLLDKEKV